MEEKKSETPVRRPEGAERAGRPPGTAGTAVRLRKPFPTAGDLLALLGIFFAAQIAVGIAMGAILLIVYGLDTGYKDDPAAMGRIMAASYFASMSITLAAVLFYRRQRGGEGPVALFSRKGLDPMLLGWAFVLMIALSIVIEPLTALLPDPPYEQMGRGFWTLFTLTIMAPLFEETLCRGVILGAWKARHGTIPAWLLSSFFFGTIHVYPAQAVGAFAIGLIIGFVYIATESIWAAIILHAANNALAYLLMAAGYGNATFAELIDGRGWYIALYAAALTVAAVSGYMIRRTLVRLDGKGKNPQEA